MRAPLIAFCAVVLFGCPSTTPNDGDKPKGEDNSKVASVALTPGGATLFVGEELELGVSAFDDQGNRLRDVTFTLSALFNQGVTIDGPRIKGTSEGAAVLTAKVGSVESSEINVVVFKAPTDIGTSDKSIDAALQTGLINEEEALTYRVYAAFNSELLPIQYKGLNDTRFESDVMEQLQAKFDTLSPATQALLTPFLRRPADEGSWLNVSRPDGQLSSDSRPSCRGESSGWTNVDTITGSQSKVNVWYEFASPGQKEKAIAVSNAINDEIWPKLIDGLGLPAPLDDSSVFGCFGKDKRLDVYLVRNMADRGLTVPEGLDNTQAPTFVLLQAALDAETLKAAVAHELMHAATWAQKSAAPQPRYGWMRDAIANWAIDYVYGKTHQLEQKFADCHLNSADVSLDDRSAGYCTKEGFKGAPRDYGAYLYFQFLAKTKGDSTVKAAFTAMASATTSLDAVNSAASFESTWLNYGRALWTEAPNDKKAASFRMWDELKDNALPTEENLDISGGEEKYELETEYSNLSNYYYAFDFKTEMARSLLFYNGFFDQIQAGKKIHIYAMWNDANGDWHEEDWSKLEYVGLCRDVKTQRAQKLIVLISNAEFKSAGGGSETAASAPYIKRSSVGCYKYTGTASAATRLTGQTKDVSGTYELKVLGDTVGLDAANPSYPNTKRVGVSIVMYATGSGTFSSSEIDGNCTKTVANAPFSDATGSMLLNPFPELKSTDPNTQDWLNKPARSFIASAVSQHQVTMMQSGMNCPNPASKDQAGGVFLTRDLPPFTISSNGDATGTYTYESVTSNWTFKPQRE